MPLPSFTLTGNLNDILPSVAAGEIATSAWDKARIILTDNLTDGILVFGGKVYNRPPTLILRVDEDGDIYNPEDESDPVLLLANDGGLNVTGIQHHGRIESPRGTKVAEFVFTAPADGSTFNLGSGGLADPETKVVPAPPVYNVDSVTDAGTTGKALLRSGTQTAAWGALGIVPSGNLPSYVDDVLEFASLAALQSANPAVAGKIFVTLDTGDSYRWVSGSTYVRISDKVTASGITDATVAGRAVLTAADSAAQRAVLGAVTTGGGVYTAASGVAANGTTDDGAALSTSNTAAVSAGTPLMLMPGTYRVASSLTISSHVWFSPGAVLKPDNGISVTLAGGVSGPLGKLFDISAGGKVAVGKVILQPEWWGAVGDGGDDGLALRMVFNESTTTFGGSRINLSKLYGSTLPIDYKDNAVVTGGGGIKCLAENSAGGLILIKNACKNVTWIGPTLDINGIANINGFAIGDVPNSTDFVDGVYIVATVKGARVKTALETSNAALYSGGGKGITVQFRARNVYANIRTDDCDIGASIEAAVSNTRYLENVVLDIQARNSHRTALFIGGSKDGTVSSNDSGSYQHSLYPGCKVRLRAQGGQDASITNPVTGVVGANYDHAGVVTLNYASGIDLEVDAATQPRCSLIRGMASASTIRVTNATMDELQDLWDTRPIDTLPVPPTMMADNVLEANVHAKTHSGVLVRPHRDPANAATRTMVKSSLDVKAFCQGGVGPITQDDSTTDEFGTSVAYRFRDMKSTPIKEVVGLSSHNPKPQWALAANGGRVAVEREAWHDNTREVVLFDTNGFHLNRMHWDESTFRIGSGGVDRRFLHWDQTFGVLRAASSAPGSETAGAAFATHSSAAAADGATTPSVAGVSLLVTANTGATTITNLTNGYSAQEVTLQFTDAFTTVANNATIKLRSGGNRTFPVGSTLTLKSSANVWYEIGASDPIAVQPNTQVFTSSGTWTKPAGATTVMVIAVGPGGPGGSGRRGAAGTVRCGGGGGGGGGETRREFRASDLGATETVTIGVAGTPGPAVTANDTDGTTGTTGTNVTFGSKLAANAGGGGGGGTNATGASGGGAFGMVSGGNGAAAGTTGGVAGAPANATGTGGGGGGGGISSADVANNGSAGAANRTASNTTAAAGVVDTTVPADGTGSTIAGQPGNGGGGGAASKTTAAQAGGAGGTYGAGGGGGGASLNGNNSGAGGAGGPGIIVVISW